MSDMLRFVLWILKPLIGDLRISFDRDRQIVRIDKKSETIELTFDQAIEKIEDVFNDDGK